MKLNKNSSFVLIQLLGGASSAAEIAEQMPTVSLRSIQRSLVRLTEVGLVKRRGVTDPRYSLNYGQVIKVSVNTAWLEDANRPKTTFNFDLLEWLLANSQALEQIMATDKLPAPNRQDMTNRQLQHLTIELAWKSSALEGNTYSLLDTELLLVKGIKADNKTSFETQMILNHKAAMEFIIDQPELFAKDITFASLEQIHKSISNNLGIEAGIRKRIVNISASNYQPLVNPSRLRESAEDILSVINNQANPFSRALLAFALMPYLQPFEDGNKRTGRMLANAILIHSVNRGISLRNTDAKQLALAYLSFYEFNSLLALVKIFERELRS